MDIQRQPGDQSTGLKRAVMIVAAAGGFFTPFMASSINIALPAIGARFNLGSVLLSWVPTSYLLAAAVAMVPFGRLADIVGRKKVMVHGMLIFTAASLGCGLSFSVEMLILFRAFQGVGSAMIFATGLAVITSVFPPGERGRAIGVSIASVYMGLSAGPVLGGLLTEHLGWRSIFFSVVPLGIITIVLIVGKIKAEWADAKGEKFDLIGAIMIGLALISLIMGLTGLPDPFRILLVLVGVVGIWFFIRWELKQESPVFEVRLFRDSRAFAFSNLAALLHYSSSYGVVFLMSLYLQYIKGFTPRTAGAVLVIQPVMMAVFSPLAGVLSDRIEPVWVASAGMALTAAALMALSRLGMDTSTTYLVLTLFVLGLGFAFFSSPNTNAIMSSTPKRYLGIAGGAVSTMRLMGQMTSMGVVTLIFSLVMGSSQIKPEAYPDFLWCVRTSFSVFTLFCLAGIGASLVRGRVRSKGDGS